MPNKTKTVITLAVLSIISFSLIDQNNVKALNFAERRAEWDDITPSGGPTPRRSHTAVYDSEHNDMIVFGGFDKTSYKNDIWLFDISEKRWAEKIAAGRAPTSRAEHVAVYDKDNDQMIVVGGWNSNTGNVFSDVWILKEVHKSPEWERKKDAPMSFGLGTRASSAVWTGKKMIIFGGLRDDERVFGRTMIYDPENDLWEFFDKGPARYGHSAVWDGKNMIIFGGRGQNHFLRNDVWILRNALSESRSWEELIKNGDGGPEKRMGATAFFDNDSDQMLIFGGNGEGAGVNNDTWVLRNANDDTVEPSDWKEIFPKDTPEVRTEHAGVYNGKDSIIIFGGHNGKFHLNDVQRLKFEESEAPKNIKAKSECDDDKAINIVSWDEAQDNDGYKIFRSTSEFSSVSSMDSIGSADEDAETFKDKTAEEGKKYFYRVLAKFDDGDDKLDKTDPQASITTKSCAKSTSAEPEKTIFVNLTADPNAGSAPLTVKLTATVFGTAEGKINYHFWWNCTSSAVSLSSAISSCGNPDNSETGAEFSQLITEVKNVNHTYTKNGLFMPKVIVERGGKSAEDRANISVGKIPDPLEI